jgi:hypothetical protein
VQTKERLGNLVFVAGKDYSSNFETMALNLAFSFVCTSKNEAQTAILIFCLSLKACARICESVFLGKIGSTRRELDVWDGLKLRVCRSFGRNTLPQRTLTDILDNLDSQVFRLLEDITTF